MTRNLNALELNTRSLCTDELAELEFYTCGGQGVAKADSGNQGAP